MCIMRYIHRIQTSDGVVHESLEKAKRHADDRYGQALTDLARKLVLLEKYTKVMDFIDQNLQDFTALAALKRDMEVDNPPDED